MATEDHHAAVGFAIGSEEALERIFPFKPKAATLGHCIAHGINQSLLRDLHYGAWAKVSDQSDPYTVSISCPTDDLDLDSYATRYQGYLKAVGTAKDLYEQHQDKLSKDVHFLPPFGLAMERTKSIQLLHYPPSGTLDYMDYLYSATNRRWENLLGYNGYDGAQNSLLERIVDLVPIAADGGGAGADAIKSVQDVFTETYLPQMLNVFLEASSSGATTQPIVAYGGPVIDYLQQKLNPVDLNSDNTSIQVLSLFSIPFMNDGPPTPVLCANHPAKFMYYSPTPDPEEPPTDFRQVLMQDLVAAGWQAHMAEHQDDDPLATLQNVTARWANRQHEVDEIFEEQVAEFTEG